MTARGKHKAPSPSERVHFGRNAEDAVARHLEARGATIVARNVRLGADELDIIAHKGRVLIVCEVRASTNCRLYDPIETIGAGKIRRIKRATLRWIRSHQPSTSEIRFDAASVIMSAKGANITYYEDAF